MKDYPLLIGGKELTTNNRLNVLDPYDNGIVGKTYLASTKELEKAIEAAESARKPLWSLPTHVRSTALLQISNELQRRSAELAALLAAECGKPLKYAQGEIDRAVQTFRIASEEAKRLPAEVMQLDTTPAGENREGIVKHFPVGLVAGIAPFNFPMNLVAHKIAPAIAAGCPIILKPASSTPLSALELARIVDKTELPKGAVTVLPMDRETGNQLVTDERFKLLTFTGSPEVGWKMKEQAGKKRVVLELGGNAGVIITAGTDLDKALPRLLVGAFAYSGQVCIHAQRFFVHRSLFSDFCEKMKTGAEALKWGSPLDAATDISAMIDAANTHRMDEWLKEATDAGAKVISGGFEKDGIYAPTILTHVKKELRVCSEEAFGPIITVEPFDDFEDAIDMLNDSKFGLQAGVYTDSITEMNLAFEKIECGGVIINDVPTFRVDQMPYGGIKDSGFGREGLKYAILDMMEPRILVKPK
ncbi:MAG: aldehyde dehydrogenase family protein [Flavobacteriales bacterium]|nr:aldehyde dehydrogenase family protein [Flavobacteriales bacterium]MCB9190811.1 aldehyde dehydrogenase family protein [Flavobacteriales bacterium]